MLLFKKHGRRAGAAGELPASQSCGFAEEDYGATAPDFGPFDYFFPNAPEAPDSSAHTALLDALGEAMAESAPAAENDSQIPPVFTYLGQFIDHDVTANTDREGDFSKIDVDAVEPASRDDVRDKVSNLRMGALNLDSLYGGAVAQGPVAEKLTAALRFPDDCAKLWIGTLFDAGFDPVPLPTDPAGDLLRIDRLLRGPNPILTKDELRALPEPMRSMFVNDDGTIRVQRAVIGDSRNDENLVVAQLHLAFARLHNQIVDEAHHHLKDDKDREAVYVWAREKTTHHYQWLVVNSYLRTICDPAIVDDVIAKGAPVYEAFLDCVGAPGPALMPMPLEFSVAAFRFGHSMVRASYDWSRRFGRAEGPTPPLAPRADFEQLFEFTGGATNPMPLPGGGNAPRLPNHWGVEWDRLALPVTAAFPDRAARKIDTNLALPLGNMVNEGDPGILRHLAKRNLRRGHRLNIPTAQACINALNADFDAQIVSLTPEQIASGGTNSAVLAGGFESATPLWFYILKEAEIAGGGEHLGPLGSRIVAETLAGLIIHDPSSYWHAAGSGAAGRWHPENGVKPDGHTIDSIPNMLRAAAVL